MTDIYAERRVSIGRQLLCGHSQYLDSSGYHRIAIPPGHAAHPNTSREQLLTDAEFLDGRGDHGAVLRTDGHPDCVNRGGSVDRWVDPRNRPRNWTGPSEYHSGVVTTFEELTHSIDR